jgi:hypothetical protein
MKAEADGPSCLLTVPPCDPAPRPLFPSQVRAPPMFKSRSRHLTDIVDARRSVDGKIYGSNPEAT